MTLARYSRLRNLAATGWRRVHGMGLEKLRHQIGKSGGWVQSHCRFGRSIASFLIGLLVIFVIVQVIESAWGSDQGRAAFAWLARVRMVPSFADLRWFTAFSECGVDIHLFYEGLVSGCDIYGRPDTANTPFSVWIPRWFGVGYAQTELIGVCGALGFLILFLFQVAWVIRSWCGRLYAVVTGLLGLPFLLAAERGSTDLVIYGLLGLLAFSLGSEKLLFRHGLAPVLGLLAVLLKIYPVFGIFGWAIVNSLSRSRFQEVRMPAVLQVFAGVLGLALLGSWLHYPRSAPLPAGDFFSHGLAPAFSDYFRPYFSQGPIISILKIAVVASSAGLAVRSGLPTLFWRGAGRRLAVGDVAERRAMDFHSLAFFSWLGCYVLTGSYDYRLLFLYPGILLLVEALDSLSADRGRLQLYLAALLLAWPFIVIAPLIYASGLGLPSWLDQFLWWAERISDTLLIPFTAGAMLVMAASPALRRGLGACGRKPVSPAD